MVIHIIFSCIFVVSLVTLAVIVVRVIKSGKDMTPRQVIRMFEKLDQKRRTN